MKLLKTLTPHFLYIVAILAALILLHKCGNERNDYQHQADYLRWEAERDDSARLRQEWQYRNDTATYRSEARQQAKRADSIQRITRTQGAEIRALYRELGRPWPVDTVRIGTECCSLAVQMADQYDALLLVDSLKDGAYLAQIDLATIRVDTLQNQLGRSDKRFWVMDSLNRVVMRKGKARPKIALGVAGGLTTGFGWAGGSVMYTGPGGTTLGADVGLSNGGMYYGGRVLRTISFRKKR